MHYKSRIPIGKNRVYFYDNLLTLNIHYLNSFVLSILVDTHRSRDYLLALNTCRHSYMDGNNILTRLKQ